MKIANFVKMVGALKMPIRDNEPYNPPRPGKLAARHTLIAEIIVGYNMATLGYSGQTGGEDGTGIMHIILARLGLDDMFGYYFIFIGYLMLQNAAVEFFFGRKWNDQTIHYFAQARALVAFFAIVGWIIVENLMLTTPLNIFKSLQWQAHVYLLVTGYFLWESTRVKYFTGKFLSAATRHR